MVQERCSEVREMSHQIDATHHNVSRRLILKSAPFVAGGLAAITSVNRGARAQIKIPHDAAKYQDNPKDSQKCSTCVQFEQPGSCKIVADPISPNGWCQFYAQKAG
jgi:hypothetical protein